MDDQTKSSKDAGSFQIRQTQSPPDPASPEVADRSGESRAGTGMNAKARLIRNYLLERSPEFRELSELREKGWKNPAGDRFFEKQRRDADNADPRTATVFFKMMRRIGHEIHQSTGGDGGGGALSATRPEGGGRSGGGGYPAVAAAAGDTVPPPRILDMCMAPGGFLSAALEVNRGSGARAWAFTLPPETGGHRVLLGRNDRRRVEIDYVDVTMLATDILGACRHIRHREDDNGEEVGGGGTLLDTLVIPADHPDAPAFHLTSRFGSDDERFGLVLCDGQVLRTHARAAWRESREARRLTLAQLSIGLARLEPGGTLVVLLHKVEAWDTLSLLHTVSRLAGDVRLVKPRTSHRKRSSFYLVASEVRTEHPACAAALGRWRRAWELATFAHLDDDEAYRAAMRDLEEEGGMRDQAAWRRC